MGDDYSGAMPLGNPEDFSDDPRLKGLKLQVSEDGRGQYAGDVQKPSLQHASLSGSAPQFSSAATHPEDRSGMMGSQASHNGGYKAPQATRVPTPEELLAHANAMLEAQQVQHHAILGQGPSVGTRDDAGNKLPDWLVQDHEREYDL